jgi:hypothetical protein
LELVHPLEQLLLLGDLLSVLLSVLRKVSRGMGHTDRR